jgi:DNA repair exonuclease SbcCD nuclease subunit
MSISVLHTADWQLGKRFGALPQEKRAVLREARLDAIDRLAASANEGGARHVLVAGDVFDSETVSLELVGRALARLAKHSSLVWHLLPGNHDPARAGGVWDALRRAGPSANVVVHLEARPHLLEPGIVLLPAPLFSKGSSLDPTLWMDRAATPDGTLRIGLAHGSVQGFGSEHAAPRHIAPDRPRSAGLAYLALGDWHGTQRIGERAWYSGTPEPDRYPDNQPGHALLVRLDGPTAPPHIERVATGRYTWARRRERLADATDLAGIEAEIRSLAPAADRLVLRLDLEGRICAAEHAVVLEWLDRLEPALFHLERGLDGLEVAGGPEEIAALAAGELREAALRLQAMVADGADPVRAVAGRALGRLLALARQVEEEERA